MRAIRQELATAHPGAASPPTAANDCAGIVQYAAAQAGVQLGNTVDAIWSDPQLTNVQGIGHADMGDLIFTGWNGKTPQHIQIFLQPRQILNLDKSGGQVEDHVGANVIGVRRLP